MLKIIPENLIAAVTASSQNAAYPVSEVLTTYLSELYKASTNTTTLSFTVTGESNALALFNTNATGASFEIVDPNQLEWGSSAEWGSDAEFATISPTIEELVNLDGVSGACMVEWSNITGTITVNVTLTNDEGEAIQVGVAWAGKVLEYKEPDYDLKESRKFNSLVKKYTNGSEYIKILPNYREFVISQNLVRDTAFHSFLHDIAKEIDISPVPWLILDNDNSRWLFFARIDGDVKGAHKYKNRTVVEYTLKEAI